MHFAHLLVPLAVKRAFNMKEMNKIRVAVVGAGPSGTSCAMELLKGGVDCMLFDRATFPREKICGGGLTGKSVHLLDRVFPGLQYDYVPVYEIDLLIDGQFVRTYHLNEPARIVERRVFDHVLLQEYLKAGGQFVNKGVKELKETGEGIVLTLADGEEWLCEWVIGADGAHSRVRKYLQPAYKVSSLCVEQYMKKEENVDNRIRVELSVAYKDGYYYDFPNRSHRVIGYGDLNTSVDSFREILKARNMEETRIMGAYIPNEAVYPLHERIILVGDAGGFASKITGEGLYAAIATGYNASHAIMEGKPFQETNKALFSKKKREKIEVRILYSAFGRSMLKWISRHGRLADRILNRYLCHAK